MHVLVIGGTRFVGRLLVWRLLAAGHRVATFNRGTAGDPFGDRIERIRGDRTTPAFRSLLEGRAFDAVVDFAAFDGRDAREAADVLGGGRAGHYVFVSSGQVYLVRERCPSPSREEDYDGPLIERPSAPRDVEQWDYGMGKRACEDALAEAWAASRFPATRIRIPIVNGERDYVRRIESYLWRLTDGGPVLVPDGGTKPMRHVYGGEVARAIAALLGNATTFGEAFNLAQDETPTLAELLAVLAELLGASPRLVPVPSSEIAAAGLEPREVSPFSSPWMSFLDPAKARAALGFVHEPLRQYLGKVVASFLAHSPDTPPEGYRRRAAELEMAKRLAS